ncbi:nucleoside diphosphate-linked moiety X motif 8 [Lates japonicus]
MFRGPQILVRSCPIRSLVLWRESHLSAFSTLSTTETGSCSTQLPLFSSDCEASFQDLVSEAGRRHPPQVSTSANAWKCTVEEDLGQRPKAVSTYRDCLSNTARLQPWRRPLDFCPLFSKTQCDLLQSHFCYRLFSSSTWILTHFCSRLQPSGRPPPQIRAVHQAAPRVVDAWRDCLSLENESRCRQRLGPNLKLYEGEKGRTAGQNQGRWASVLVSLCSVEGQPAFLFTLRSSTLKGRHKGDVSFAGGKSDLSDRDVVATALREAREELGVTVLTEQVWGVLKPLRDSSGMMIAPVLANLGPVEELSFKPNPGEVEEIFTLSLSHLCDPKNCGYTHFRTGDKYGYTLPVFRNGKHRVWGLTAVALDHTLKLIVPP